MKKLQNDNCGSCGLKNKFCTCAEKRDRRRNYLCAVVTIVMLCLLAFIVSRPSLVDGHSMVQPQTVSKSVSSAHGYIPGAPSSLTNEQKTEADHWLELRVQRHPRKEIREDFNRLIADGTIAIDWHDGPADGSAPAAMFGLTDTNDPFFAFGYNFINHPKMMKDDRYIDLIVYHEYVHCEDYRTGKEPPEAFKGLHQNGTVTLEQAKRDLRTELRAYLAECELAREMGWLDELFVTRAYRDGGLEGMAQHVLNNELEESQNQPHMEGLTKEMQEFVLKYRNPDDPRWGTFTF